MSATQREAAIAPAALIPKPWLTGSPFLISMSNPRPPDTPSTAARVTGALDKTPSITILTSPSSLSSARALAPRPSLTPIPRDPDSRGSAVLNG